MPRYFFNIHDGCDIPDTEGSVLDDAEAARVEAVAASGEMIKEHAKEFWTNGDWEMHVVDEQGTAVCDLAFTDTSAAA